MNHDKNTIMLGGTVILIFGIIAFYLAYLVLKGVFVPLLFAILISVVFYPFYVWLLGKIKNRYLSSLCCIFVLIVLVLAAVSFVVYLAVGEVVSVTKVFTQSMDFSNLEFLTDQKQLEIFVDDTVKNIDRIMQKVPYLETSSIVSLVEEVLKTIPPFVQELSSYIISLLRIGFDSAASLIIYIMIFFISFFFLLIDGKSFLDYTFSLLPINALHERQISKRFTNLCYAWIVVNLLIAFIQGSIATIGFLIIGVPSPLVWGVVSMIASLIPFVGSAIIWGSISIIFLILGKFGSAIFIILWGLLLVSSSDNILRPLLLKEGIKIHPMIVFLAVFGGFFAFGVTGLIIGPLIMVFVSTLLYIYQLEFGDLLSRFHMNARRKDQY